MNHDSLMAAKCHVGSVSGTLFSKGVYSVDRFQSQGIADRILKFKVENDRLEK